MATRPITATASIDTVWEEVVYTEARLKGNKQARDLAESMSSLLPEVEDLRKSQRGMWRAEIVAQAAVDAINDELDDLVADFASALLFMLRDRKSPRFERYFSKTPYSVVRMSLAPEIEFVKSWPESIKSEPEDALKAFAPRFEELIRQGSAALEARAAAAASRADHRVRSIEPLIAKVNSTRNTLFAALLQRSEERRLGKYWPDNFFRAISRKVEEPAPPMPPTPAPPA